MATCTCPPTGWPDPECPEHGLTEGQRFPPMDRHALPGEDARAAQRRLYLEAQGRRRCELCGREGRRGFEPHRRFERREDHTWRCVAELACSRRMKTTVRARRLRLQHDHVLCPR